MSTPALTEAERDQLAHAIGHHSAKGCSVDGGRNYYATNAGDPMWLGLVDRGLAYRQSRPGILPDGEATFHLTPEGIAAVEADPRSARKGSVFTVRFKGYDSGVTVYAETHAKARYAAVLDVIDAWNVTAGEAFKRIASCRKGHYA